MITLRTLAAVDGYICYSTVRMRWRNIRCLSLGSGLPQESNHDACSRSLCDFARISELDGETMQKAADGSERTDPV